MKKATANYNTLAFIVFIAFAFLLLSPINTYSNTQNTTELEYEIQSLENILGQVPNITVELNERQKSIIHYLSINKSVTNKQYCSVCKTNRVTAFRDLNELEKKNIILRKSKGRSLYYILLEANNEANNE